ncbi:MAG: hypothetical protein V1787_00180 [Candidatus Micrarchaeota archaeon]
MANGFPFDEKIVFTVSAFLFIILSFLYFQATDFSISYTSAIGATLSVLLLYLLYKLHVIETASKVRPAAAAPARRRRRR